MADACLFGKVSLCLICLIKSCGLSKEQHKLGSLAILKFVLDKVKSLYYKNKCSKIDFSTYNKTYSSAPDELSFRSKTGILPMTHAVLS